MEDNKVFEPENPDDDIFDLDDDELDSDDNIENNEEEQEGLDDDSIFDTSDGDDIFDTEEDEQTSEVKLEDENEFDMDDFSEETEDSGEIKSDEDSMSIDDIDAQIAALEKEIGKNNTDSDDSESADSDGALLSENALMEDEDDIHTEVKQPSYDVVDNDLITPSGDIRLMNPEDSGDTFELVYVDIKNICVSKRIRANGSVEDLVKSIKSTGLLKPVDVAKTNVEGIYILLDGYRRIKACARAGKRNIPCIVNTKVSPKEIPIIEAMLNHEKDYSIKEMIDYIDYLEKQKGIMSASMIEYLLQMNSGEYTKLKDILNDNDDEIVSKMMDGLITISEAFKKLEQRRKKESADEKELKKASKVYEEDPNSGVEYIAESGEMGEEGAELSEEEIGNLAISASELEEVEDEDLDTMIEESKKIPGFKPHKQDPKYRERLDPTLRKTVLARDNNTCQICKIISGQEFTEVLDVHHIQEVYLGGSDDIDNLITACTVCHKLVHQYGRGELNIRPIDEMTEIDKSRFKRIVKLGTIIRNGMAAKGMKLEQLKKLDNAASIGRTKPGSGQEAG